MGFRERINKKRCILMEGALGERLKREFKLIPDEQIALAAIIYQSGGKEALKTLWLQYAAIAKEFSLPFIATTPTRRANRERIAASRFDERVIADNVNFLREVQKSADTEMYIGGLMGCKGDAYTGEGALPEEEAAEFHFWQAEALFNAGVDFLFAGIMPTLPEAAGMARSMAKTGLPYIISFTIEQNGRLIDGHMITDAIEYIDNAVSPRPEGYMANCVHPDILYSALSQSFNRTSAVKERFLGLQANTSPLPYCELDGCDDLKCSEPKQLADKMLRLREIIEPKIFGGCCGTDDRHMREIAKLL